MKKVNTVVVPIITPKFIGQMLETLYKYTEPNFYVIVMDCSQTLEAMQQYEKLAHLWIRPYRGLGFAKNMNTGIRLTDTKYVTLANDDIEFMDKRWWQGILDTFASDPKIVGVNPMSPKEATWGYGRTNDNFETWQPPAGYLPMGSTKEGMVPIKDGQPFPDKDWTEEDYTWLLKNHPTWKENSMCDAIAMWGTVFKTEDLIGKNPRLGLLDERFFPGGGEDYDMNARAYSDAWPIERDECDTDYRYRMVGTARSWVWHKWTSSRNLNLEQPDNQYLNCRPRWNANEKLWPGGFDVWGRGTNPDGSRFPYKRDPKVFISEL